MIIPLYVFLGLFIGILISYILSPEPEIIIQHPTPENAGKILYLDDQGVCYRYQKKIIS